ncbi:MAG: FHA domain-containing protein [Planctomycetota bacterium]|jgi:hypothetical protein
MRCPKCNYNNLDGSAVCNLCGELLHTQGAGYYQRFRQVRRKSKEPEVEAESQTVKTPEVADPRAMQYQIVCFPLDPIELQPGDSYSIGRSGDNDIIFPVGLVSRSHARIEWVGDDFILTDLDSHNGTYINGQRIEQQKLSHGDQIKIGPYLLEFYTSKPGETPQTAAKKSMDATQDLVIGEGSYEVGPFSGRLAEIELRDICRLLNMTRKTGKLEVKTPSETGEIHFADGEIGNAKWADLNAMQALAHMLVQKDGNFRFMRETEGINRVLEGPTSKLLIDALRLGTKKT